MPKTMFSDFDANYLALKKPAVLEFAGKVTDVLVWKDKQHEHINSCEICLVVQGNGITYIGGVAYPFTPGDLLVYNERVAHYEDWQATTEPPILYYAAVKNFSVESMEDNKLLPHGVSPVLSSHMEFQDLKYMFKALLEECERKELGYDVASNGLLQVILIRTLRIINDQYQLLKSGSTHSLESMIQDYIEKNYTNKLTLGDIANHFHISQFYLERLFKDFYGNSPIHYLIQYRLEKAKVLLRATDLSVKAIAAMTGYETVSYFCVAFKKAIGTTPTDYRCKNTFPKP